MSILRYSFTILFLILLFYRVGILLKIILKRNKDDIFNIILNGFVGTFAVFEIIALPFNIFNWNISILYYIEIITFFLIIILSFFLNWKRNIQKKDIQKIDIKKIDIKKYSKSINKKTNIITIAVLLLIAIQIFLSSYLYTSNADDSFYISWAQQAKQLEQYQNTNPSLGQEGSIFPKAYLLNSWEIFLGFIARLFNIHVSTLAHTIFPMILIAISYMAYYILLRRISKKNANFMLLILAFIFLFSGVSERFRGYTLLIRIWQGKTILTNIFIPYILYHICNLKLDGRKIVLMMITNIATIAFNPIAIWLFPLLYFFFTIVMLCKKQIKNVLKMLLVILPNLIILPIYLKIAVLGATEGSVQSVDYIGYIDCLKDFIRGGKLFVVLYIFSIIYIIWKGNQKAKRVFVIVPIITFLTALNPLFSKIVQKYVTTSTVYWRLFWLIPIELTIAYATSQCILKRKNNVLKIIFSIFILLVISISGKNIYSSNGGFQKHINVAKIPQNIINETNFILNESEGRKVLVIAPPEPLHATTMRQLSSDIILFYSRALYSGYIEDEEEKTQLYNKLQDGLEIDEVYEAFQKFKVDFIIADKTNKENLEGLEKIIAKIVYEDENYIIIRNEQYRNYIIQLSSQSGRQMMGYLLKTENGKLIVIDGGTKEDARTINRTN